MRTYTAREIAEWFVAWADEMDAGVDAMALQKLLYYAQGEYIGEHGRPLFSDRIEAWQEGPVVAEVHQSARVYGRNPIDPDAFVHEDFDWGDYAPVQEDLVAIWRKYGVYAGWALREKAHRELPWVNAFVPTEPREITEVALKEAFA